MTTALPSLPQSTASTHNKNAKYSASVSQNTPKPHPKNRSSSPSNQKRVRTSGSGGGSAPQISLAQSICLELLVEGHVHSYIDFFNIVHPTVIAQSKLQSKTNTSTALSPLQNISTSNNDQECTIAEIDLSPLKSLLTTCERSLRATAATIKGGVGSGADQAMVDVYNAKKALGYFYNGLVDVPADMKSRGLLYLREAYDVARGIYGEKSFEIEAALNLGHVLADIGDGHNALKLYEQSRRLATEKGDITAEKQASKSLINAKILIAGELEHQSNFAAAISHYSECIEIIEKSAPDDKMVNDLNYCLGNAYKEKNEIPEALQYLDKHLTFCKQSNDLNNAGKAQLSLASCYEISGNLQQATQHLQDFISNTSITSDSEQKQSLAQACNQLGGLYNKLGEYEKAVTYFDKHYALACELSKGDSESSCAGALASAAETVGGGGRNNGSRNQKEPTLPMNVGTAQIQLGLSKANAFMENFFNLIADSGVVGQSNDGNSENFAALLDWKASRSFAAFVKS
ncbi:Tetratricopeptide repeat protein 29 [Physocladia obscura]|uniref:Tetratricopeptide repeat protein 29 n=1 Tax=Physocladia obscura TaxID=109957 RepID=A0AAD5T361_9FUNG|nr:Tetratricopeptide repeat protein 29 [Physocladia obscura]